MKNPKTIKDLTNDLYDTIDKVSIDRDYVAQATEIANLAGKMINAQKISLEYNRMRKVTPNIDFLNS
jgi:hypothetical protein